MENPQDVSGSTAANPITATTVTWDPLLHLDNRNPTKGCLKRIRNDLKSLFKEPIPGIYAVPDDVNATVVHALLVGAFETPYEGGFFYFIVNFPDNYPSEPPKVKLMTTGGGSVRMNPNLYANGKVCLSILGTWSGPEWNVVQTLSSVLLSIQSLMNERPYYNEPGFERGSLQDAFLYNECIRHETLRIAVLDMVNNTCMHQSLPEVLQDVIKGIFPSFLESYVMTCRDNLHKDGQPMIDPFGANRGRYCYKNILEKLLLIDPEATSNLLLPIPPPPPPPTALLPPLPSLPPISEQSSLLNNVKSLNISAESDSNNKITVTEEKDEFKTDSTNQL